MDPLIPLFKNFLEKNIYLHNKKILEIGAGEGNFTGLFSKSNKVTALDINEEDLAKLKIEHPSVTTVIGKAEELPFPNDSFDIVLFSRSLHHVPAENMKKAIDEAKRVATKYIIIIEPGKEGEYQKMELRFHDERKERNQAKKLVNELNIIDEEYVMPTKTWEPAEIYEKDFITNKQKKDIKKYLEAFTQDGKVTMTTEHWFGIYAIKKPRNREPFP